MRKFLLMMVLLFPTLVQAGAGFQSIAGAVANVDLYTSSSLLGDGRSYLVAGFVSNVKGGEITCTLDASDPSFTAVHDRLVLMQQMKNFIHAVCFDGVIFSLKTYNGFVPQYGYPSPSPVP